MTPNEPILSLRCCLPKSLFILLQSLWPAEQVTAPGFHVEP